MNRIVKFLIFLFFTHCSMNREGKLSPETSWSESGKRLVIYQTRFQESDSWNPLMGTTNKSEFQTYLEIYEWKDGKLSDSPLEVRKLPYWLLPPFVFYHEGTSQLFFIRGIEGSGFGTSLRVVSVYDILSNTIKDITDSVKNKNIWSILPSPDLKWIAMVTSEGTMTEPSGFQLHIINLSNGSGKAEAIAQWSDGPESALSWNSESSKLYFLQGNQHYSMTLEGGQKKEPQFPECYNPGTSFGSKSSDKGEVLEFMNPGNFREFKIQKIGNYSPFLKRKFNGKSAGCD